MSLPDADVDVTVLIATRDRADSLAATLESLGRCDFPGDRFRVVVADNGDDVATREACEASVPALDLDYLVAPEGGKNAALNRALERTSGELLLFTDDDVVVDKAWITAMWDGASRWPGHDVFGGRVLPQWPSPPPDVVLETKFTGVAYTILDPDDEEGPHPNFLPFGPNFAVRRRVFEEGVRFDPSLGPRPGAYTMGGETELLERVRERGADPIFLPASRVHHRIRSRQYDFRWLLSRARKYGRSVADKSVRAAGDEEGGAPDRVPMWCYMGVLEFGARALGNVALGRRAKALERAMEAAVEVGKVDYFRRITGEEVREGPAQKADARPYVPDNRSDERVVREMDG